MPQYTITTISNKGIIEQHMKFKGTREQAITLVGAPQVLPGEAYSDDIMDNCEIIYSEHRMYILISTTE